jgi:hypothetical protein
MWSYSRTKKKKKKIIDQTTKVACLGRFIKESDSFTEFEILEHLIY